MPDKSKLCLHDLTHRLCSYKGVEREQLHLHTVYQVLNLQGYFVFSLQALELKSQDSALPN